MLPMMVLDSRGSMRNKRQGPLITSCLAAGVSVDELPDVLDGSPSFAETNSGPLGL